MKIPYLAATLALAVWGCSDDKNATPASSNAPDAAAPATPDATVVLLTESEVAGVVEVAHQGEIDQADLAQGRASNAQVVDFATKMKTDHTAALARDRALFTMLGITPARSALQDMLMAQASELADTLRGLNGPTFDKAYIDVQVTMHTKVLQTIDSVLLPSVTRAELRAELMTLRTAVDEHLTMAKMIQSSLPPA